MPLENDEGPGGRKKPVAPGAWRVFHPGSIKLAKKAGMSAFFLLVLLIGFLFDSLLVLLLALTGAQAGKGDSRNASDQQQQDQHSLHTVLF